LLSKTHDPTLQAYPAGDDLFLLCAPLLAIAIWHFVKHQFKAKKPHHSFVRVVAASAAMLSLAVFMFGPMLVVHLVNGVPLGGPAPEGAIWFLIIGGGLGSRAGAFVHNFILKASGHFTENEIGAIWRGED